MKSYYPTPVASLIFLLLTLLLYKWTIYLIFSETSPLAILDANEIEMCKVAEMCVAACMNVRIFKGHCKVNEIFGAAFVVRTHLKLVGFKFG